MATDFSAQQRYGHCPGCAASLGVGGRLVCPRCGISLTGPEAAELSWVTAELVRLEYARRQLVYRREFLLEELKRQGQRASSMAGGRPVPATSGAPVPVSADLAHADADVAAAGNAVAAAGTAVASAGTAGPVSAARPEMSGRSVANLLLAVGGLLVVIAAAAFTVANWGSIGPAGRGVILLALAIAALAAPWPLSRRGLTATAESVAGIGLALTVADTYLVRNLFAGSSGVGLGLVAAACAVLATAWAAYGSVAPPKGPGLAAIALAQLPLPLAVAASTHAAGELSLAVLATAGGDLILAYLAGRRQARIERQTANAAAVVSWLGGIGIASIGAVLHSGVDDSLWLSAAFLAAAAIGLRISAGHAEPALASPESPKSESLSSTATGQVAAGPVAAVSVAAGSVAAGPVTARPVPAGPVAAGPVPGGQVAAGSRSATSDSAALTADGLVKIVSGALIAVGVALPAAAALPGKWVAGVFAVAGALIAVTAQRWARSQRSASQAAIPRSAEPAGYLGAGGLAVLGGAGLWVAPAAAAAMFAPFANLGRVWPSNPAVGAAERLPAATWNGSAVTLIAPAVLLIVSIVCWRVLAPRRSAAASASAALAIATLAGGSVPVAGGLPGWTALVMLTALAVLLAGSGTVLTDRLLAGTASWAGAALAACAAVSSLTGQGSTIAELAVLAVMFGAVAWRARSTLPTVLATAQAVAASAGLACAVPLAIDTGSVLGAEQVAAFAVLGVAMAVIAVATLLRRSRPCHALVLDLATVPVVVLAAALAARQADAFSVLASAAALLAATTAWLRDGRRQVIALGGAALAAVAAIVPQFTLLADAVTRPYRQLTRPWSGLRAGQEVATHLAGLRFAMIVLAVCGATAVVAAGAWRGNRGSRNALATVLPVVAAPAGAAAGLGNGGTVALLLAFTLALTTWAAVSRSLAPAGAALAAAWLTLPWALATRPATVTVLGCLSIGYSLCAWRARLVNVRVGAAAAAVIAAGALAGSSAVAAGWPGWLAGLMMLAAAGGAQLAAAALVEVSSPASLSHDHSADLIASPSTEAGAGTEAGVGTEAGAGTEAGVGTAAARSTDASVSTDAGVSRIPSPSARSLTSLAVEIPGWLIALVGVLLGLAEPVHASVALAVAGALCVGVACRADRRPLLWAGLGLGEAALCFRLAAAGVRAPEPYTLPASVIMIAFGWHRSRRSPEAGTWLIYGPGLAVLLVPSLVATWSDHGWIRPLLLGLGAAGVTLAGARARLRAPLLIGAAVAVTDAGRQLAPAIARLTGLLPRWVPIALVGLILLAVGATYEARLKDLGRLRAALRRMR